jgi:hypothetical protein
MRQEVEYEQGIIQLDPHTLYTQEHRIYGKHLSEVDMTVPIYYGRDINNVVYITDGNHRSVRALQSGEPLFGRHITYGNFDVTTDPDFHLVSEVAII